MSRLNTQEAPVPGGGRQFYLLDYDRRGIDKLIIGASYLLMPFAFMFALLRMLLTHYKNQRKASNYNLLFHVLVGAFVELSLVALLTGDLADTGTEVFFIVTLAVIFLVPAFFVGNLAAKAKYRFSKLCHSYLVLSLDEGVRYIGTLASRTGQSESDVRRDVQYLRDMGLLTPGTAIYEGQAPVTSPAEDLLNFVQTSLDAVLDSVERPAASNPPAQTPPQLPKAIRCPGCGAQNTVYPGKAIACDYCGTTLTYS